MFSELLSVQGSQFASAASVSFLFSASPAPTPIGLDGVMLVCPSSVPHEVEKQCPMMSTYAINAGYESPGQKAFPLVGGPSR